MDNFAIELKGLSKNYGKRNIFENTSYAFETGKSYGIVGPNGSGKSVLFKLIAGLTLPTLGKIFVEGKQIAVLGSLPESIGYIIENPGFLPELSGFKNLEILSGIRGLVGASDIKQMLEKVGLSESMDIKTQNYSLGMLQRLALAQALLEHPRILLLDEPFNSIDKEGVAELRQVILNYQKEYDATILLTSHNEDDIRFFNSKIVYIRDHQLV
ncbi:ABC transporter, ATP-binding protein [Mageeibacillus indolicus UPII9-5]|uniref:ABC transporter, ATP-binding protein n=1 Tax=Mageeibacillus indolicus (strain UPII9-5) TaxID=699246 RepID=D3R0D3_MAGIU|nr:ATP-binding cassette domain-containing protein [Mageeibacillus indolicus]ADC91457.1 ABC transporter, ATP-binding protein [Mageeibacillus indolicus UPII9-5]